MPIEDVRLYYQPHSIGIRFIRAINALGVSFSAWSKCEDLIKFCFGVEMDGAALADRKHKDSSYSLWPICSNFCNHNRKLQTSKAPLERQAQQGWLVRVKHDVEMHHDQNKRKEKRQWLLLSKKRQLNAS